MKNRWISDKHIYWNRSFACKHARAISTNAHGPVSVLNGAGEEIAVYRYGREMKTA